MPDSEYMAQYKLLELLEKRLNVFETQVNGLAQELSRMRNMSTQSRDEIIKLSTALLGNSTLGMDGLLVRLEEVERRLVQIWWAFIIAAVLSAGMAVMNFYFIFVLSQRISQ